VRKALNSRVKGFAKEGDLSRERGGGETGERPQEWRKKPQKKKKKKKNQTVTR